MTNSDIKQELDFLHYALNDLTGLCGKDGIQAVQLDTFVKMIEDRFSDVHEHIVSTLNIYELVEISHNEGKEAADKFAQTLLSEDS